MLCVIVVEGFGVDVMLIQMRWGKHGTWGRHVGDQRFGEGLPREKLGAMLRDVCSPPMQGGWSSQAGIGHTQHVVQELLQMIR